MMILHCLWIGAVAGLAASRLIRSRSGLAPVASSIAVGMLGALLGGLVDSWLGPRAESLPHSDLLAATTGAVLTLVAWAVMHRHIPAAQGPEGPGERR